MDIPEKNYKFTESDIAERKYWKDYMKAYEKCIQKTSVAAPWYVVPADDKKNMRIIVCKYFFFFYFFFYIFLFLLIFPKKKKKKAR